MKKNKIIGFLLVSVFILSIVACSKNKKEEVLYVGTNAEFPPFEYLLENDIVGFDIDLVNEIALLIGKKIEMKNIAFDGLLPALQAKKIDIIIAGMTATEERRQFVNFSDKYYVSKQAILVDKDNTTIKTFDSLPGKTVGVVLGYTGDIAVSALPNVDIKRYNGTSEAVLALKANKIDAVVVDSEPAKNYSKQNPEIKMLVSDLVEEEYAIALRKDETELLDQINVALQTLKDNGTYDELIIKHFK